MIRFRFIRLAIATHASHFDPGANNRMECDNSTEAPHEASEAHAGEDGFTMNFSFDVFNLSEKIADYVEDMMRLSAHGHFGKARAISDGVLAKHTHIFPVAAERMRLLYDQGDFDTLSRVSRDWLTGVEDADLEPQENVDSATRIVRLFWRVATGRFEPVRDIDSLLETYAQTGIEEALPEEVSTRYGTLLSRCLTSFRVLFWYSVSTSAFLSSTQLIRLRSQISWREY